MFTRENTLVWAGADATSMNAHDLRQEVESLRAQLKRQEETIAALRRDVMTDPLTGLLNRRAFDREMARTQAVAKRYGRQSALLVIDLNSFKAINDELGHQAGDDVLRHVANVLRQNTRATDIVARVGGDEFCIILNEVKTPADAQRRGQTIADLIAGTPVTVGTRRVSVTASVGCHTFDATESSLEILAKADSAMYAQKGRDERAGAPI
jgi:diguanylate cyclase (GGDEF)-like protein